MLKLENYLASQASLAWMRYFLALFCDDYGKLLRFAAVGLIVMAVFMALNAMFGFLMDQQAAFFCAYPPALLLHFSLNKYWTFEKHEKSYKEIIRFGILYSLTLGLNVMTNKVVLENVNIYFLAFLVATGVSTVMNFIGQKFWVFK